MIWADNLGNKIEKGDNVVCAVSKEMVAVGKVIDLCKAKICISLSDGQFIYRYPQFTVKI